MKLEQSLTFQNSFEIIKKFGTPFLGKIFPLKILTFGKFCQKAKHFVS